METNTALWIVNQLYNNNLCRLLSFREVSNKDGDFVGIVEYNYRLICPEHPNEHTPWVILTSKICIDKSGVVSSVETTDVVGKWDEDKDLVCNACNTKLDLSKLGAKPIEKKEDKPKKDEVKKSSDKP